MEIWDFERLKFEYICLTSHQVTWTLFRDNSEDIFLRATEGKLIVKWKLALRCSSVLLQFRCEFNEKFEQFHFFFPSSSKKSEVRGQIPYYTNAFLSIWSSSSTVILYALPARCGPVCRMRFDGRCSTNTQNRRSSEKGLCQFVACYKQQYHR